MKTIIVNHLKSSQLKKIGFFKKQIITDYDTSLGIVREFSTKRGIPKYKLMTTKELVNVKFV